MNGAEVLAVSERSSLVRFPRLALAAAVAAAHALRARLAGEALPPASEVVLGAGSLLLRLPAEGPESEAARWRNWIERACRDLAFETTSAGGAALAIEAEFGGAAGPDLEGVAAATGLPEAEVVERLCAAELVVAFVGFSPGFPYLIGLPPALELPRRDSPRPRVPAGSVAIAGPFAGIYPSATPGGWHLLGRTDHVLFDAAATPPARLAPADSVRLVAR